MTTDDLVARFFEVEGDPELIRILREALSLDDPPRASSFIFNVYDVTVDVPNGIVTIEDDLPPHDRREVSIAEFTRRLEIEARRFAH